MVDARAPHAMTRVAPASDQVVDHAIGDTFRLQPQDLIDGEQVGVHRVSARNKKITKNSSKERAVGEGTFLYTQSSLLLRVKVAKGIPDCQQHFPLELNARKLLTGTV